MRDYGETLAFAPRLPAELTRLCVRLVYRGRRLRIEISPGQARYELLAGEPLELLHHGEPFTLEAEAPQVRPCPVAAPEPPARRSAAGTGTQPARCGRREQRRQGGSRPPPISRARSYWLRVEGTELI